jgi:hypothetical protein
LKDLQQITGYLLRCMGVKQTAEVVVLHQGNEGAAEGLAG